MVKKAKQNNQPNPDHVESLQEIQLKNVEKISLLEKRAEEIEAKLTNSEEKYKRVLADYQNQERRHKEQEALIVKMASASLIEKLLLNLDSLKLAQSHLNDKGLQMIINQFTDTFSQEGLSVIETDGKDFDPLTMDCVEIVPGEKDKVVETISEGFYLYERTLRPAKVKVGSGS